MFKSILQTDYFLKEQQIANNTIINEDRLKYFPIFNTIKLMLKNNISVIFSDSNLISYNKNKLHNFKTTTQLVIYSTHARKITTLITNKIHEKFGKFVQMRSIIPNKEYDIIYDLRTLVKIYHIYRYKKMEISVLFNTININNLLYFPIEVELMDVYHKLYLPNCYNDWNVLQTTKNTLQALFNSQQTIKLNKLTTITSIKKCVNCKEIQHNNINQIKILMMQYFNNENYILVDDWSQYSLRKHTLEQIPNSSIQVISENDIELDYRNIMSYLSKFIKYGIFFKKRKLYIPKNNRILKYTLYVKYPGIKSSGVNKPFLDIYNCGMYELIPFTKHTCKFGDDLVNIKIACLYVNMYFILVNLWIVNLIFKLGNIDKQTFINKNIHLNKLITWAKKTLPTHTKTYIGINYDEKTQQKIIISKKNIKKKSYYPENSINLNKKYKLIATSS
jgi:hypothetical protein